MLAHPSNVLCAMPLLSWGKILQQERAVNDLDFQIVSGACLMHRSVYLCASLASISMLSRREYGAVACLDFVCFAA